MAYIKNYESDEHKHQRFQHALKSDYDPDANPSVKSKTTKQQSFFNKHIKQYTELISWAR